MTPFPRNGCAAAVVAVGLTAFSSHAPGAGFPPRTHLEPLLESVCPCLKQGHIHPILERDKKVASLQDYRTFWLLLKNGITGTIPNPPQNGPDLDFYKKTGRSLYALIRDFISGQLTSSRMKPGLHHVIEACAGCWRSAFGVRRLWRASTMEPFLYHGVLRPH